MKLIDADRLLTDRMKSKYYHLPNGDTAIPIIDIEDAPTIDAVEVVRCGECKKYETLNYTDRHTGEVSHKYVCKMLKRQMLPRDFCSCGERREDGEE